MRILLVEDEQRISSEIRNALESGGFIVDSVTDGNEAWSRGGSETYAAIVLDLMLPGLDGFSILRRWREEGVGIPVLIISGRGQWRDRVECIDAGADDYLVKPFAIEELLARVRAIIRRTSDVASPLISAGDVCLDTRLSRVSVRGSPIHLTPTEFRALRYLMHSMDRVVSASELAEQLYDVNHVKDNNAVEVVIARVRRKIDTPIIETRRGFGYTIASQKKNSEPPKATA